jgi:hypothetical protein
MVAPLVLLPERSGGMCCVFGFRFAGSTKAARILFQDRAAGCFELWRLLLEYSLVLTGAHGTATHAHAHTHSRHCICAEEHAAIMQLQPAEVNHRFYS